jgi:hypothetical protein
LADGEEEKGPQLDIDIQTAYKVFVKSLSKKFQENAVQRSDVVLKTIFRMCRSFYKFKLDVVLGKRRKNKPRPEILKSLDTVVETLFRKLRWPTSVTKVNLANYIGALVLPKCITRAAKGQARANE